MNNTQSAIISLMLCFPNRVDEIVEQTSEVWFTGQHRTAYEFLSTGECDTVALQKNTGISHETIAKWLEVESSMYGLKSHVKNAENEYVARSLNQLGQLLVRGGSNEEALQAIDSFQLGLGAAEKREPVSSKEGMRRLSKELMRRFESPGMLGMTYGLNALDEKTEGLHKGDLVVIAAPSSMGKTAFATGVVEAACKAGNKALIFSAEMTVEQLLMRTLAASSKVPMHRIRSARFTDADWPRMTNAFGEISQLGFWIDETAGISLSELTRKVKRYVKKEGVDLVMVDYLQIMGYDKGSELQELDKITTALKCLAKDANVCIVMLSQLNRGNQKDDRKPVMTDLRGSGMIENNADVILMPWRPAANCKKCQENIVDAEHDPTTHKREAEIIIAKQRQGERNISIPVLWREEVTRFDNLPE